MGDDIRTAFEFADLCTVAARHVLRVAARRQLAFSFDHRGPLPLVVGDPVAMRRSLHRLFCGAIEVIDSGFVALDAETRITRSGRCEVRVEAAGRGTMATPEGVSAVLARLQLAQEGQVASMQASAAQPRLRRVKGSCPITGVPIGFECVPSVGFVFSAQWSWPMAQPAHAEGVPAMARPARAWLIDSDRFAAESLAQRLQRLGWETVGFASCADAVRRLHGLKEELARPSLLRVSESPARPPGTLALQTLRDLLPVGTRCLYCVAPGSMSLIAQAGLAGFEARVQPFSPKELQDLAVCPVLPDGPRRSAASPAPSPAGHRPLVLVADDSEIDRAIAATMVRSLGFDAITASDGMEALEHCERMRPDIVLTDLEMPVLGGIEATRRLREMQRAGLIVPCSVVGATADDSERARASCLAAGMDACLAKPLLRSALHAELHRLCIGCAADAQPEFRSQSG